MNQAIAANSSSHLLSLLSHLLSLLSPPLLLSLPPSPQAGSQWPATSHTYPIRSLPNSRDITEKGDEITEKKMRTRVGCNCFQTSRHHVALLGWRCLQIALYYCVPRFIARSIWWSKNSIVIWTSNKFFRWCSRQTLNMNILPSH